MEWVPLPTPKVTGMMESPFMRALVGVIKEMKASRKSSEWIAQDVLKVLHRLLSQTMALVDLVELVVQGKHFVRTREMGQLESDSEELPVKWPEKAKGRPRKMSRKRSQRRMTRQKKRVSRRESRRM